MNSPLWHPCTQMQTHENSPPIEVVPARALPTPQSEADEPDEKENDCGDPH